MALRSPLSRKPNPSIRLERTIRSSIGAGVDRRFRRPRARRRRHHRVDISLRPLDDVGAVARDCPAVAGLTDGSADTALPLAAGVLAALVADDAVVDELLEVVDHGGLDRPELDAEILAGALLSNRSG